MAYLIYTAYIPPSEPKIEVQYLHLLLILINLTLSVTVVTVLDHHSKFQF